MRRMLTRRGFVGMAAASVAAHTLAAQQPPESGLSKVQISTMMWNLKKLGTFEEVLDKVAHAGYHHVEMTGEFKKWSEDDYRRIIGRMEALQITVDATSGVGAGLADPAGPAAFLA